MDTIKEGECVRVETQDWTGGQIKDDDSAEDMKNINLTLVCWDRIRWCFAIKHRHTTGMSWTGAYDPHGMYTSRS